MDFIWNMLGYSTLNQKGNQIADDTSEKHMLRFITTKGKVDEKQLRFQRVSNEDYKMETAPFDSRFPNQNQTRNCWQNYVDYFRCIKLKGDDYELCNHFQKVYKSICPNDWVKKWDEQRNEGTFSGRI